MTDTNSRTVAQIVGVRAFAVMLCTIGWYVLSFGQTIDDKQLSKLQLPSSSQVQLLERLNEFIEYEKSESYLEQFDLLAKDHLATLLHMDVNKESYVRFKQETRRTVGKFLELEVKDVKIISDKPERLNLLVVVKLQKRQSTYQDSPICEAYLIDGMWYFSLLYIN